MNIKTSPVLLITLLLICNGIDAQTPLQKKLPAVRVTKPIKIDGLINDEGWKDAPMMTDLVEFRPTVGAVEKPETKTVSYLLYDDEGIYFGGFCYERTRDSIATELVGRDGFGTNDYVGLIFDTYYDKQNGFEYFLTPLGEQWDSKMSTTNGEDFSWNAVWKGGAVIHDNGWSFEMFIPYSAIRFGKDDVQNWGLNITRRRRKTEQQYTWNPIDPNVNGFLTQEGIWTGISNIKPPLRLQFSPYFSTYVNHFPSKNKSVKDWTSSVNGGMDIKYGINQAFTLDAILIPDFGQVRSDNVILNLTPFEVRYQENRPFFTEGFELFNKGNLVHTRRIGKDAKFEHGINEYSMKTNEIVKKNPPESKLINATKISGRTQKGLGIGIMNAVTNNRYWVIRDTLTGTEREVLIEPLTNYNVLVLDQTLKNNSSISLVNTNTTRTKGDYDANVTAGLFSFDDKKNMWNVNGKLAVSNLIGYLPGNKTQTGYSHSLGFGKTSGSFNFQIGQELVDKKYNNNDLGYFQYGNTLDHYAWFGYRWNKPTKWYNNLRLNANAFYSRQLNPSIYRSANFNINANSQLKNLWFIGGLIGYEPHYNDFFESHIAGQSFDGWWDYFLDGWFETNNAKKYGVYGEVMYVKRSLFDSKRYSFSVRNSYRFNNKLTISQRLNLSPQYRNIGFGAIQNGTSIFAKRDIRNVENTFTVKYSFNAKMNINVWVRHYWIKVDAYEFYTLLPDGSLAKNNSFSQNVDQNFNAFNIDAVYTWEFAPGSFINVAWKNSAQAFTRVIDHGYFKNFNTTMKEDDNNNLSLKVIYFLDYLQLKGKRKK